MTRGVLAFAILFLCGCSREKPEAGALRPQSGQPAAPAAAAGDRPVIVAFGDSLTAGFGVDPGKSYPDFLQKDLDARGYRYRVVNQGSSGETSTDGLARVALATELKPEVVILELGANDGLRGLPVSTTRNNLDKLIVAFQGSGAKVLLTGMTLPPNYGPEYIRPFEAAYRGLAREHKTALVPFLLEGVGGNSAYMQGDGLHPNVEGNRRVAEVVMRYLEPLLHK